MSNMSALCIRKKLATIFPWNSWCKVDSAIGTSKTASIDLAWNYLRMTLTITLLLESRVQSLMYENHDEVGILKIAQTSPEKHSVNILQAHNSTRLITYKWVLYWLLISIQTFMKKFNVSWFQTFTVQCFNRNYIFHSFFLDSFLLFSKLTLVMYRELPMKKKIKYIDINFTLYFSNLDPIENS